MASEPINVPIKTSYDDKGSKQALQDIKKIDSAKPSFEVTADTKKADRDIDGLLKKVDKLDSTSAQILLASNAADTASDIAGVLLKIDQLDAEDPQVDIEIARLAQLKGDLEQIEGKFKELDDLKVTPEVDTTQAASNVKNLGDNADQSRSVLANMVGNSTQDLGALGGVAGTAGMALGQLGEYAAEGNISLGNLVKVAGPMALVTLAATAIGSAIKGIEAEKAFRADLVEKFTDAMKRGRRPAETIRDILLETGKLTFETGILGGGGLGGLASKTRDLVPIFQDLGFETGEWLRFLDDPRGTANKFIAQAEAMGTTNIEVQTTLIAAAEGLLQYADSSDAAAEARALLSEINTEATGVDSALIDKLAVMPGLNVANKLALDGYSTSADDAATSTDDFRLEVVDLQEQLQDLKGELSFERAANTFEENVGGALKKISEGTALTSDDILSLQDDYITVAEYLGQNPAVIRSNLQRIENGEILEVWADTQSNIDKRPDIGLDSELEDPHNLREVYDNTTAYFRGRPIPMPARVMIPVASDRGTPSAPWPGAIAGEVRPEIINDRFLVTGPTYVPPGTKVTSGAITESLLAAASPPSLRYYDDHSPVTVNIHVPRGTRPDDIIRAGDKYARRNGRSRAHR